MNILGYFLACIIIDHWTGGAGLFRGEKSRAAAELYAQTNGAQGSRNFLWDTRAIPFSIFFLATGALVWDVLGFGLFQALLVLVLTGGYITFRQRSHRPVFKALNANNDPDQGNKLTSQAINTFTSFDMDLAPMLEENRRFRLGIVWGAWYGFLGLIFPAILLAALVHPAALALSLLGTLFGPLHRLFGHDAWLDAGKFGRSCAELAVGGLIVAPFGLGAIALVYYGLTNFAW